MLVGPWVGALCVAVVLVVQALVFGDGGVAMLGLNITNMALLGTAAAYLLIALLLRVLPRTPAGLAVTAFVSALVSVVVASQGFVAAVLARRHHRPGRQPGRPGRHDGRRPPADRHRRGPDHRDHGASPSPKVRPDLVYALRALQPAPRRARRPGCRRCPMRKRSWGFVAGGLLVALLLAGVVSNYASSHPDGLDSSLLKGCTVDADDKITGGSCPAQRARDHELADSPLADYGMRGVDNELPLHRPVRGGRGAAHLRRRRRRCSGCCAAAAADTVRRRRAARRHRPTARAATGARRHRRLTGRYDGWVPDTRTCCTGTTASPVHRLPPEVKIAAMVLFTVAVVATPREAFWAFGGYAVLVAVVAALARVGPRLAAAAGR